jgi:cell wall-associated NlpC family hydrolase
VNILTDLKKYLSIPYKLNGRTPEEGLDCWGLVVCIFKDLGISLPAGDGYSKPGNDWYKRDPLRYHRFLQKIGEPVLGEPQPYDIIYFTLIGNHIVSHTGVMLDNNTFIHTVQKRNCRITKLDGMWQRKLRGARRIIPVE